MRHQPEIISAMWIAGGLLVICTILELLKVAHRVSAAIEQAHQEQEENGGIKP